MYERSYMHRDVVTHAAVAAEVDFIITGSADGHVKFWKKRPQGVEFAKHFRAHVGPVEGMLCQLRMRHACCYTLAMISDTWPVVQGWQ